ncbi:RagB/SusD family nutrient uptake outer membrane protein [Wenyingzhuangia sp. IMCC45574]
MKKIKFSFSILALTTALTFTSCEDVIETESQTGVPGNLLFETIDRAEALMIPTYNSTEGWAARRNNFWAQRINIEGASFEAKFNFQDRNHVYQLRDGGWTSTNTGDVFSDKWRNYWSYIQEASFFIDGIEGSTAQSEDPEKAELLVAEARFLRANLYRKLINYFGGVPIFTKANSLDGNYLFERSTYKECVEYIVSELDAVAEILPETRPNSEFGRATKVAALAVKSRTLLYAASDLHDSSLMPQTENKELFSYDVSTKWQDAENAAKDVIDIVGNDALIQVTNATEYQNLFLSPNDNMIFARPYTAGLYEVGIGGFSALNSLPDQAQSPNGYGGWALCSPTHNFALEFNFADGTSTGGLTPASPNDNREMRYYANLLYQGANYRGREVDYALVADPDNADPGVENGSDSPAGLGNTQHSSKTGYNIRKFHDETLSATNGISPDRPYILFRVAEIYLNYAEALAEQGKDALALEYLNKVSSRALQPTITASGADLLEAVKRERRVELCFEGHNFFDERRWLNESYLGFDIKGLTWTKANDGTLNYTEGTVVTRPWLEKMYYLPIPQSEREKSPTLIQNPGY